MSYDYLCSVLDEMFRINNKKRMTKMMRYARILILVVVSMAAVAGATSCKKESKEEKGKT